MNKKLTTWTLSGLMIGPILGSGIIFLPTLAYKSLGSHAILAWIIMMFLGCLFAYVFAKMTILTTSNEGMSVIIGSILGNQYREMSSNFLTIAVFFGPAAVVLTAASFVKSILPQNTMITENVIAIILLLLCSVIVALGITTIGNLVLLFSTIIGLLLVCGSITSLFSITHITFPSDFPDAANLGHTLLLLFWSIIGWEILGNYIEDIKDPEKTMMQATKVSLIAIVSIYLITTFALQNYINEYPGEIKLQVLLTPLLGSATNMVFSILASLLCICTVIMFVGAVARQMASRGKSGLLPVFCSKKLVPLLILTSVNLLVLTATAFNLITLENIVGIANTFFISNALLGLIAGFISIKNFILRASIFVLISILTSLLFFSSIAAFIFLIIVVGLSFLKTRYSN